jgi:formylglycine-generating enzyme required for sulfatase activity
MRCVAFLLAVVAVSACSDGLADDMSPLEFDTITIHSKSGVSLDFVYIPPGRYVVGQNMGPVEIYFREIGFLGDLNTMPRRWIEFENGFYLGQYQVTAEQFATFLNDVDPVVAEKSIVFNRFSNIMTDSDGVYVVVEGASRYPANTVTWEGAVEFTKWFTQETGWLARLPAEDEWEAAARTAEGYSGPTGGVREIDPPEGRPVGVRAGSGDADVDAFESNVTANGLWHTLNTVGDWTSDVYIDDRGDLLPDERIAPYVGGHTLKRCMDNLWEREPGGDVVSSGIYGMRVLLEATESGSPKRVQVME